MAIAVPCSVPLRRRTPLRHNQELPHAILRETLPPLCGRSFRGIIRLGELYDAGLTSKEDIQRAEAQALNHSGVITAKRLPYVTVKRSLSFTAVRLAGFTSERFQDEACTHGERQGEQPFDSGGFRQALVGRTREGAPLCCVFG